MFCVESGLRQHRGAVGKRGYDLLDAYEIDIVGRDSFFEDRITNDEECTSEETLWKNLIKRKY